MGEVWRAKKLIFIVEKLDNKSWWKWIGKRSEKKICGKKEFNKTKERIRIHDKSNRNPIEHIKKRKEIEIEIKIK